ncbi:acyltransferase family protein [Treponema primitia]|uniref:acyltransferase family protein n=1 Tax=Treponema primitia TaxID=88058 RepID=UPI00025555F9|nr:acyltransferase [Treponema primitia]
MQARNGNNQLITDSPIKSIQLARAIAAVSVVYEHCTIAGDYKFTKAGSFGVDIFFIISGFIITYIVLKTPADFFIKRVMRVVPLYIIATVLTTLTVLIFPSLIRKITVSLSGFIKSILFIPYKENRGIPILGQGWTLNYEMFFYVVMSLCILFVKNKKYLPIACGSILVLFLIITNTTGAGSNIYIIKYYRKGLFPEFIYGIALYYFYTYCVKRIANKAYEFNRKALIKIIMLIIIAAGSYIFLIYSNASGSHFSKNRNIYYGIPSLLLVTSLLLLEDYIGNNIVIKIFLKIGEASYVMYLFHYHIIAFFSRIVFPVVLGNHRVFTIELIKLIFAIVMTIVISIVLFEFVDKPIQNYLKKVLKRQRSKNFKLAGV